MADQVRVDAALLADLPDRGLLGRLVIVEMALGQRENSLAVGGTPRRNDDQDVGSVANDDPTGGELLAG